MPLPIALDYRPALLSATGIGRATRELARALAERSDLDVHLFGHSWARAAVPASIPPAAHLHRLPIPGRFLPGLCRLGLGADLLAGGARVFHWTDFVQPPVSHARRVLTVHDLAFVHDPTWHGANAGILTARTRAAIAVSDLIVAPSPSTAKDLAAFAPTAAPVRVVPFGADHVPDVTGSAHPLRGRAYALCVGTIEPRKNHASLLVAWRRLRPPRPLLVVVGKVGWECAGIVEALGAAVAEGFLVWLQSAPDTQIWPLMQHAQLLVYPSLWEGFGFPPLEAMQLGVPVVANDIAPLRELGDDAMQFTNATDAAALAEAIDRVLHDPPHHTRLSQSGRTRAAQFRWSDCAAAHAAIYREVGR